MNAAAERFFVDTNVVLYSVDAANPGKQQMAHQWMKSLWRHDAGRISWQVVNEFNFNATRKLLRESADVRAEVETLAQWEPVGFGLGIIQRAWYWTDKAGLPYWDGLILASAESAGCRYLLSEDFQPGQRFGGITVVSPFLKLPEDFGLV